MSENVLCTSFWHLLSVVCIYMFCFVLSFIVKYISVLVELSSVHCGSALIDAVLNFCIVSPVDFSCSLC